FTHRSSVAQCSPGRASAVPEVDLDLAVRGRFDLGLADVRVPDADGMLRIADEDVPDAVAVHVARGDRDPEARIAAADRPVRDLGGTRTPAEVEVDPGIAIPGNRRSTDQEVRQTVAVHVTRGNDGRAVRADVHAPGRLLREAGAGPGEQVNLAGPDVAPLDLAPRVGGDQIGLPVAVDVARAGERGAQPEPLGVALIRPGAGRGRAGLSAQIEIDGSESAGVGAAFLGLGSGRADDQIGDPVVVDVAD